MFSARNKPKTASTTTSVQHQDHSTDHDDALIAKITKDLEELKLLNKELNKELFGDELDEINTDRSTSTKHSLFSSNSTNTDSKAAYPAKENYFDKLPIVLQRSITAYLCDKDLAHCNEVAKNWQRLAKEILKKMAKKPIYREIPFVTEEELAHPIKNPYVRANQKRTYLGRTFAALEETESPKETTVKSLMNLRPC